MAESLFAAVKDECLYRTVYTTKPHAGQDVINTCQASTTPTETFRLKYQTPNDVHYSYLEHDNAA